MTKAFVVSTPSPKGIAFN